MVTNNTESQEITPIPEYGSVSKIWTKFAQSLKSLFDGHLPKHRHNDQFIAARDTAIELALEESTAIDIAEAYRMTVSPNNELLPEARTADVVLKEMEVFPSAVSVYRAQKADRKLEDGAFGSLLKSAKTVIGSVKDIFKLNDRCKQLMVVLNEGIELFEE